MSDKSDVFLREFIIGFGFCGGMFTRIGTDPETEIIKALLQILEAFTPSIGPFNPIIVILISAVLLISTLFTTWITGGWRGLLAVFMAWVSGYIIVAGSTLSVVGVLLLLCAIVI